MLSIVLNTAKSRNERFVEKCRREGCSARAEAVKAIPFYRAPGYKRKDHQSKFYVTYEYSVNGKTYRKKSFEQAKDSWGNYERYRTVYYDKRNPKKSDFARQKNPAWGCLTGIVFAVAVMLAAVKLFP